MLGMAQPRGGGEHRPTEPADDSASARGERREPRRRQAVCLPNRRGLPVHGLSVRPWLHLSPADAIVGDSELRSGQFAPALNRRKRMELVTTKTLDSDIANPAISGLRWPVAANGIAATL